MKVVDISAYLHPHPRMQALQRALGRTYRLADGMLVRVAGYDARCVRFESTDPEVRFINNTVTHDEFFMLSLEEV